MKDISTKMTNFTHFVIVLVIVLACFNISASGLRGVCTPSGFLPGKSHSCNKENDSDCCKSGQKYPQYKCSPPTTGNTPAQMTINSFAAGGDGGGPSECDNKYHSDAEMVVALSTGWYNHGSRCLKNIRINGNGRSVLAKVVDECDSVKGCDEAHDYQPPCPNNVVDASPAVWKALKISGSDVVMTMSALRGVCSPGRFLAFRKARVTAAARKALKILGSDVGDFKITCGCMIYTDTWL